MTSKKVSDHLYHREFFDKFKSLEQAVQADVLAGVGK